MSLPAPVSVPTHLDLDVVLVFVLLFQMIQHRDKASSSLATGTATLSWDMSVPTFLG